MTKKKIEIELIALRACARVGVMYTDIDPFIAYQNGDISKRKLIEIIANALDK